VTVVAIDGPAGAGKSTVARAVARALGFAYLDTGAMYRAAALAGGEDVAALDIELRDGRVLLDGEDVTEAIRTPAVSEAASRVAARPEVRAALVAKQQRIMSQGDWVADGRDIATVVAPDAELKVFLTATPEERARRRAADLGLSVERVLAEQRERDERDGGHGRSIHAPAPDAVTLDTTGLSVDEVVQRIREMLA
jgi:cytidylate kinase